MDKERFFKAMKEEFRTCDDLTHLEELFEEYSLVLQLEQTQLEIKNTLVDFALDVIDLLKYKDE
jgi:hypothetical protein